MTRGYQRLDIYLSNEERDILRNFTSKGNNPGMIVRRANVILSVDRNGRKPITSREAARLFGLDPTSVSNIKRDYLNLGIDDFLKRKARETPPREIKITGDVEASIIALSRQEPPKGHSRWTLKLLASKAVEYHYVESISDRSIGAVLKKAKIRLSRGGVGVYVRTQGNAERLTS